MTSNGLVNSMPVSGSCGSCQSRGASATVPDVPAVEAATCDEGPSHRRRVDTARLCNSKLVQPGVRLRIRAALSQGAGGQKTPCRDLAMLE